MARLKKGLKLKCFNYSTILSYTMKKVNTSVKSFTKDLDKNFKDGNH